MTLWLLTRLDPNAIGWDEAVGFVVRARDELRARGVVAESKDTGDEGSEFWLDTEQVQCDEIEAEGAEGVILDSFRAG